MSEAHVTFHDEAGAEVPAETATLFSFKCPRRRRGRCERLLIAGRTNRRRDPQGQNGGSAMWDFDGNAAAPTFSPSINCKGCWHGYIRAGRCVTAAGRDEPT